MIRNMNLHLVLSSANAMFTLIEKGMTRVTYDLVQPKTAQSWDNQVDFSHFEADPEVTSRHKEEIDEIFNPVYS